MTKKKDVISEITATIDEVRRGRPVSPDGPRNQVIRVNRDLVKRAVEALASVGIEVKGPEAVTQLVRVGVNVTLGTLTVMNEQTRLQFVRETEEQAIRLATHRTVEAVCKLLGIEASYNPTSNEWLLKTTHPIQPGDFTLPDTLPDTLPLQPAVRH